MSSPCRSRPRAPHYVRETEIPQAVLEHEAEIARARAKEEGKPDAVVEKIVAGGWRNSRTRWSCSARHTSVTRMSRWKQLVMQNIAAIGENVIIRRFQRWELGEKLGE